MLACLQVGLDSSHAVAVLAQERTPSRGIVNFEDT